MCSGGIYKGDILPMISALAYISKGRTHTGWVSDLNAYTTPHWLHI